MSIEVIVASLNPVKINAVRSTLPSFPRFRRDGFLVTQVTVESGVHEQPRSLDETILGASNRAHRAWYAQNPVEGSYAFGIESGVFEVERPRHSGTRGGPIMMDVCVCVVVRHGVPDLLGISSAWEVPVEIATHVRASNATLDAAARSAGTSDNENLRLEEGLCGLMSRGLLSRESYTSQAVLAAMISMPRGEW